MKNLASIAALLSVTVISGTALGDYRREHCRSLTSAAGEYRDAVVEFERHVRDLRYIDRYDRRLVDDLEDSTSKLRSAARHPDQVSRLIYAWQEIQSLHARVERAIFHRACYPPNPSLARCWERVAWAYGEVAIQLDRTLPAYGIGVPPLPEPYPAYGPALTPPAFGGQASRSSEVLRRRSYDASRFDQLNRYGRTSQDVIARPLPQRPDLDRFGAPPARIVVPTGNLGRPDGRRQAAAAILGSVLNRVLN